MTLKDRCPTPRHDLLANLPTRTEAHAWAGKAVDDFPEVHRAHAENAPATPPAGSARATGRPF